MLNAKISSQILDSCGRLLLRQGMPRQVGCSRNFAFAGGGGVCRRAVTSKRRFTRIVGEVAEDADYCLCPPGVAGRHSSLCLYQQPAGAVAAAVAVYPVLRLHVGVLFLLISGGFGC